MYFVLQHLIDTVKQIQAYQQYNLIQFAGGF